MRKTRLSCGLSLAAGIAAGAVAVMPGAAYAGPCDGLLPVAGEYSSGFGGRGRGFHPGVDIRAPNGSPITAARSGRVVFAGRYYAYGLMVDIEHADGSVARYAHLSRIAPGVAVGAQIGPNGSIGAVGRTGRTTGAHLHIELRVDGRPVNPWPWLTQTACLEDRQVAEAPR
ncbi:M23 family metallopeptidase [Roseomonas terrae]|uniref:M23 family metallopeptidase n=1 Tax=Neoroseomonas terrae TaxID=424799 RepID=A0ABS5EQ47_9PROT|nr:M23 family metallopeptidase [Neoroseomonas terrae]MBR0653155.1 M23 family metallopeptidase [Neoroseomonas terrae]